MIKPNNRASPEGKQADLATLEEVFPPPLVAGATTFPPTSWWDYGCLAMGQCLYRKA